MEITTAAVLIGACGYFVYPMVQGSLFTNLPDVTAESAGPSCGNGKADAGEACDDGNLMINDGCTLCRLDAGYECKGQPSVCSVFVPPGCGNAKIEGMEMCDDGNPTDGDGCSSLCEIELGAQCRGNPSVCMPGSSSSSESSGSAESSSAQTSEVSSASVSSSSSSETSSVSLAGHSSQRSDGWSVTSVPASSSAAASSKSSAAASSAKFQKIYQHRTEEEAELRAGMSQGAASSIVYQKAHCGDGLILDSEKCDDKNSADGDGCSATCAIEKGFICRSTPSICSVACGDGVIHSTESCDDMNNVGGDGCSANCRLEAGYACTGEPSSCVVLTPDR